jgi:hexosaminidase
VDYRGLLIDTSRHYLHPNTIKSAIDAVAFNKVQKTYHSSLPAIYYYQTNFIFLFLKKKQYNVLHWHVTDAQSFPIESKAYPRLIEFTFPFHSFSFSFPFLTYA